MKWGSYGTLHQNANFMRRVSSNNSVHSIHSNYYNDYTYDHESNEESPTLTSIPTHALHAMHLSMVETPVPYHTPYQTPYHTPYQMGSRYQYSYNNYYNSNHNNSNINDNNSNNNKNNDSWNAMGQSENGGVCDSDSGTTVSYPNEDGVTTKNKHDAQTPNENESSYILSRFKLNLTTTPIDQNAGDETRIDKNKHNGHGDIFSTRIAMQTKNVNAKQTSMTTRIVTLPRVSQGLEQALNIDVMGLNLMI